VYTAFNDALTARVSRMRLGSGLDPATTHGPLISPAALERVEDKVADAVARGATVAVGGKRPDFDSTHPLMGGNFYEPTVLTGWFAYLWAAIFWHVGCMRSYTWA
jgi:succinate-semialdehyde dehydrogenase/glutarate-semialdehyde dehydrogenase